MASKRILLIGVPLILVIIVGGITAALAHGGAAALIHACVDDSSGTIKIVGANETCKKNWSPLDWNIQGIQGDPGPEGPEGPAGPVGPAGSNYPKVGFFVGAASGFQCDFSSPTTVDFPAGSFHFNDGGGWIDSTNRFKLPEAGVYQFNTTLNFSDGEPGDDLVAFLTSDGFFPITGAVVIFEDHRETVTLSVTYKGDVDDEVWVVAYSPSVPHICLDNSSISFSGALIYPTTP